MVRHPKLTSYTDSELQIDLGLRIARVTLAVGARKHGVRLQRGFAEFLFVGCLPPKQPAKRQRTHMTVLQTKLNQRQQQA